MKLLLMRGVVVVRETSAVRSVIFMPDGNQNEIRTHRGIVLGKGKPALNRWGSEVPQDFEVGDLVQYHWEHHEKAATRPWPADGRNAVWLPQSSIDAVIEI